MADPGEKNCVVFQVINFDREEMFFGHTDVQLEQTIERIAKDPSGPAAGWKKGDLVHWRPLTEMVDEARAKQIHRELQSKVPPNKFKVIPTPVD